MTNTILDGNFIDINGIEIAASKTNGITKLKFTNKSNPSQKLSFIGTKGGNYIEKNVYENLIIDLSFENHLFKVMQGIKNITFTNINSSKSGYFVFKNTLNVTHNEIWPVNIVQVTNITLKSNVGDFYVIEYYINNDTVFLKSIL